jgi:hypothetical protein
METPLIWVTCDGCGLPAFPAHIAERLNRLELATRYRPIHIGALFLAAAPLARPEDDFYRPPDSGEFFDLLMDAVEIPVSVAKTDKGADSRERDVARLVEFQRRGYYVSYLSECPLPNEVDSVSKAISRLGSTLVRRVRFNYRPKQIAILGSHLSPMLAIFEKAGMPSSVLSLLEMPGAGDAASAVRFRETLESIVPGGGGSA